MVHDFVSQVRRPQDPHHGRLGYDEQGGRGTGLHKFPAQGRGCMINEAAFEVKQHGLLKHYQAEDVSF